MGFMSSNHASRMEPDRKKHAERMVFLPTEPSDKSKSIEMKVTKDSHALMTARTEGGVVEISTGWKSKKSGSQRFENTYDMYTKSKPPKIN